MLWAVGNSNIYLFNVLKTISTEITVAIRLVASRPDSVILNVVIAEIIKSVGSMMIKGKLAILEKDSCPAKPNAKSITGASPIFATLGILNCFPLTPN